MNNMPPYCSEYLNYVDAATQPFYIKCENAIITRYFQRSLLLRALSVIKPIIPETWHENYVMYCLYTWGYLSVINTDKYGVIPQQCTVSGYDVQYQPADVYVQNPLLQQNGELRIGRDCTLIKLCPDYMGFLDVISYYANMLSIAAETLQMNLFNSQNSYVFVSKNPAVAETLKGMYKDIHRGRPAVAIDKEAFNEDGRPMWMQFNNDVGKAFIAPELIEAMRAITSMFDEEIGIPSNNNPKRERAIVDEVNANNISTYSKMEMCLDSLKKGAKQAREMFGIEIDFDWRNPPKSVQEGGGVNVGSSNVNSRNVPGEK